MGCAPHRTDLHDALYTYACFGQIFPMVFTGACIGSAIHQLVPDLPVAMVVSCCTVAVPCAIVPAPLAMVSLVCVMLSLGGDGAAPVAVRAHGHAASVPCKAPPHTRRVPRLPAFGRWRASSRTRPSAASGSFKQP